MHQSTTDSDAGQMAKQAIGDPVESVGRLARLEQTALMDSPADAAFDRFTRLASGLLKTPVALVSLVDDQRQFFKSAVGLPEPWNARRETPLTHSFCKHVVRSAAPLIVENAPEHPLVRENLAVRDLGVIAYAGMPLTLHSGEVLGALCVIDGAPRQWSEVDQSTLRDLAAAVITEVELRLALAAKEDVLAIVSHDLKSPLTAIGLSVTMAQKHVENIPAARRAFRRIDSATQRMEALVHQVLDQGRGASPDVGLHRSAERLGSLAAAALDSVRVLAEDRGVFLVADPAHADVVLDCDPQRLGQALGNLVHNAVQHTPAGGKVAIRCEATPTHVRIAVEDEGEGVPPEERPHLFERGWRGRDTKREGHGIGLTIAKTYVKAHRGTLTVEDRAGGPGASFVATLPRQSSAPAQLTQ